MTRRTGFAPLLPVLLLFAALACPAEAAVPQPTGTASLTALADEAGCAHGWDYGDASPRYPTMRAQRGPRHLITIFGALTIGTSVTADSDGRPDDGDVDDGLATPVRISAGTPQVSVRVRNTSGFQALLAGWLDTSGDGFAETERAVARVPVGATHVTLRWALPAGIPTGAGELRLRLYRGRPTHPVPIGLAIGGEVEDYQVTLVGASPQPTPTRPTPRPTPTKTTPQPAPSRPTPSAPARASRPTPTPTAPSPPTPAATPTPSSRPTSARARTVTHAEPSHPPGGLPLTWSIALLIVAPAAAGAAHAVGRAARRRR